MLGTYLCYMSKPPKLNRKQQLEIKATELFKEKGYSASSMRDLATRVGIEAPSLYSHINSKEEILQTICFRIADEFFEAIDQVDRQGLPSLAAKLDAYIVAHTKVIIKNTSASLVFFNEWKHLSEPFLNNFKKRRHEYENRFHTILKKGIEKKEFILMDEKFVVLTILSALNWIPHWYDPHGKWTPTEIGHHLSKMLLNGIMMN